MKFIYASLIQKGKFTLAQVPEPWRAEVAALIGEEAEA